MGAAESGGVLGAGRRRRQLIPRGSHPEGVEPASMSSSSGAGGAASAGDAQQPFQELCLEPPAFAHDAVARAVVGAHRRAPGNAVARSAHAVGLGCLRGAAGFSRARRGAPPARKARQGEAEEPAKAVAQVAQALIGLKRRGDPRRLAGTAHPAAPLRSSRRRRAGPPQSSSSMSASIVRTISRNSSMGASRDSASTARSRSSPTYSWTSTFRNPGNRASSSTSSRENLAS